MTNRPRLPRSGASTASALVLAGLVVSAIVGVATPPSISAQSGLPTRLVRAADLVYQGSFKLPATSETAYAHGVIAFNPVANSLFVVGHTQRQQVAEFSIPGYGGVATTRQSFRDPLEGRIGEVNPGDSNGQRIGGLHVVGNNLIVTAYSYYDAGHTARASHFKRSTSLSTASTLRGPFRIGSWPVGFTAGYFAPIPTEWQGALGGDLLNGQCCIPIISRTSYGPSVSSVRSTDLVAGTNAAATMLLAYPADHPTLGTYESTYGQNGSLYNASSRARGVAFPAGTASVLFFGGTGLGAFCYGTGSACGDPVNRDQSQHAYPYVSNVWAYDAHDLAAVRRGEKQPWQIRPYATWEIPNLGLNIQGVATDPATGRIFVAEATSDEGRLRIHVFTIAGSSGSGMADTTAPSVSVTSPGPGSQVGGQITLSASASDSSGVAGVWFTVDGQTVTGEDTTAPYQLSWNSSSVASGTYTLRAVARDYFGNARQSAGVTITVTNSAGSSCTSIRPGPDWNCYNGNWLPPGMPIPGQTSSAPSQPKPQLPSGSGGTGGSLLPCLTIKPGGGWNCYNGNWLPPGMPIPKIIDSILQPQSPTVSQPSAPNSSRECTTVQPGIFWVCRNGNWLPPGHPDR